MDDADDARTAFRKEEKRYQLHREQTFRTRRNKKVGGPLVTRPTSLQGCVDLRDARALAESGGGEHGVRRVNCANQVEAYEIPSRPGCMLIPNYLDLETQRRWLVLAVTRLCEPPAETNHAAAHGVFHGLWEASHSETPLWLLPREDARVEGESKRKTAETGEATELGEEKSRWTDQPPDRRASHDRFRSASSASSLLEKLRWATLGAPYDWTTRTYKRRDATGADAAAAADAATAAAAAARVPLEIASACVTLARAFGYEEYRPSAGLVNYYRRGDALAGHVDDAERDLTKPIVSFSLGSPCVFLAGAESRDERPVALLLRSGDAIVLSREARRRFHGVPRIFTGAEAARDAKGNLLRAPPGVSDPALWLESPAVAAYVADGRVNVSVRDID